MKTKFGFIKVASLLPILFLASCKNSDLPQLKGRYEGLVTKGASQTQVVAQIPDYSPQGSQSVVEFSLYSTLASSIGDKFSLIISDTKNIELKNQNIDTGSIHLALDKNCAKGSSSNQDISICWSQGKLDLIFVNRASLSDSITINLVQDNDLPPNGVGRTFSLDELVGRAKFINYSVSQEAERVFQAQQNIGVARGNLLPKLNLKSLLGIITGDYLSAVGSVLPFLFPNNWYQWKASKELYKAERNSFASLRGNEMNMVESLYYLILRDQLVLSKLKAHILWMRQIQETMKRSELAGTIPQGTADYFGTSIALLEKDRINFEAFIRFQFNQLAQATALPPINGITGLMQVQAPDLTSVNPLDPNLFFKDAQTKSYEVKSLGFLLQAAQYSQQEIYFSFFDLDGSGGIGFGTPYQLRVSQSQQGAIQNKIKETNSLIELQSSNIANEYNQALDAFQVASSGKLSTEKRVNWLVAQLLKGDASFDSEEFVNQLTDTQYKVVNFIADEATSQQLWLIANAKLNRLLLNGYYSDLEAAIPSEPAESTNNSNSSGGGN